MLHDIPITKILIAMEESEFDFWGTGSRFASFKTTGDFDFFVESSGRMVQFLKDLGFLNDANLAYHDSLVTNVMKHRSGVDVQLTVDVDMKKAARDFIAVSRIEYTVDKDNRRQIWNMVIKGLESQRSDQEIPIGNGINYENSSMARLG